LHRYKAAVDDGKKKLHRARWNRQPLVPPDVFYGRTPKKRDTIVRNFPMEHLGITGEVSETVIGHLHNRTVKVTLDSFVKTSWYPGKNGDKGGKFADLHQLQDGINTYTILLHAIWPSDYSGVVLTKVLNQAKWGEIAGLSGRYHMLFISS